MLFLRDRRATAAVAAPAPSDHRTDEDVLMLDVLDLRERGGRLEPTKLEIDPATTETVREILQRVFVEGDEVLLELVREVRQARRSATVLVTDEEFAAAERDTPADLRAAIDDLIGRLRDLAARQIPREWWEERDGVALRRDRPAARERRLLRARRPRASTPRACA